MRFMILALALVSQLTLSQNLQDVIYKKDGSILRGSLIEQDFENGRYKIQLTGGSVFSVTKEDIEKITKEAPTGSTNNAGVNINIENNPTINQTPVIEQNTSNQPNPYIAAYLARNKIVPFNHVIMVGYMGQTIVNGDDNGVRYNGLTIAYQYNFTKHLALHSDFTNATYSGEVIDGETYETYGTGAEDNTMRSIEVSGQLSTNNYRGMQFYTGLGMFSENYDTNYGSESVKGTAFTLGMGYSWKAVQTHLRIALKESSDYADDFSGTKINLQVGFNF